MNALVKSRAEPGLWLEDVPEPELGINDVKIWVRATGICGTDVHIHRWDGWAQRTIPVPLVVGHEFVGVVEVGSNVSDFAPGELVGGEGHVVCGRCRNCMAGRRHLCAHSIGLGVQRPGAFAEYVALPMTNVWHHWPRVRDDVAAIFDPFGNAVHTALAFPVLGEDVLVTGAGPIGCMAVAIVRHAGARHVVVTDLKPYRLDLARRMGATLAIDPRERDLADVQRELEMTEGFDVMLEMSGNADALRSGSRTWHTAARRDPRHPDRRGRARPRPRDLQHAHPQGHLRPRDVRDLVPDERHARLGPRHLARDHAPIPVLGVRAGLRGRRLGRVRQGAPRLEGGLMYGAVRDDLTTRLEELRDQGLHKHELTMTTPQGRTSKRGGAGRCAVRTEIPFFKTSYREQEAKSQEIMARESKSRWKSGPPRTRDQLQTYIPYLFNRLANRWNLDQNRDLSDHGINNVVFRTLSVLFIYKTLTVNEVAVLAVTEQSTASRMVKSMVSSGLVKREIAEEDQRRRVVGLTPDGEALLRKIWPIMASNYDKLIEGIEPDDIEVCARVLAKMVENIRQNQI